MGISIFLCHFLVKFANSTACTVYESCFEVFGLSRRTPRNLVLRTLITIFNLEYGLQARKDADHRDGRVSFLRLCAPRRAALAPPRRPLTTPPSRSSRSLSASWP